jgi:hypothetical protein
MSHDLPQPNDRLFDEIHQLIDSAKHRAAIAINAEITLLYWQVGNHPIEKFCTHCLRN